MSSNICGNCANFKPNRGEKFFNCNKALHAGVRYGMQVRADTRSCDAFTPLKAPTPTKLTPEPKRPPATTRDRPVGLCPWGRLILIAVIVIAILLLSWLGYTCVKSISGSKPTPTPTPILGPTPTPMPQYIYQDFEMGNWSVSASQAILVHSPTRYWRYSNQDAPTGTTFIYFKVTITNLGIATFHVVPSSFWITDSAGYTYGPLGNPYYYPWKYNAPTVYTGSTVEGEIPYNIPDFATGLYVNYTIDPNSVPPLIARWKLPW